MDHPEDVAEHVERRDQAELQSVIHHHVDEHDVARVLVEEAGIREDLHENAASRLRPCARTQTAGHWRVSGVNGATTGTDAVTGVSTGFTCAAGRCRPCCC